MDEMNTDKYLDDVLKRPDAASLNSDITKNIMLRIQRNIKRQQEQKRFVFMIASLFLLIAFGIAASVAVVIIKSSPSINTTFVNDSVSYLKSTVQYISGFLPRSGVSLLGTFISLGLLISAWFWFDMNKKPVNHSN